MDIITWDNIQEEQINEQIKRKMFWGENIMVVKWELAPSAVLPEHSHEAEQIVMVHSGRVTLIFPDGEVTLSSGDMHVVPPFKPHGVRVGPDGCSVTDIFSPIRQDFIDQTSAYLGQTGPTDAAEGSGPKFDEAEAYRKLHGHLRGVGVTASLEQVKAVPVELLARYAYEKECVTMGQLRAILNMDKQEAKNLLREWKHGDDHSESSLKKNLARLVMLPGEKPPPSRS